jgi:hypothetical protein
MNAGGAFRDFRRKRIISNAGIGGKEAYLNNLNEILSRLRT